MLEENPKLTPSEIQSSFIMASLRKGGDWNEVEKAANRLVDKKWIANEKENIKRETRPYGENFEAVVTFKLYCDNQDELLIHKVNERRGNPDFPSFVFKTSKERMKIALNMDREGEHFMREEYCYFDGKVKRCRKFVTLTASTYHPILKKQIPLAIMETEKEDSENIELFWTLFNTSIKKAAGDNTVCQKVKKCYGCGSDFAEKHRHSPHNIIVRHCDRRLMRSDELTGQFQYSADYSNTYYHFDVSHIRRKNPLYDGKVYIDFVKYQTMESEQRDVIRQSNFEVILLH